MSDLCDCGLLARPGICPACDMEWWNRLQEDREDARMRGEIHRVDMTAEDRAKAVNKVWRGRL